MKLNELSDKNGARKGRTRIGRGIGSGKGKTGGRGVKGQKSRSGVAVNGFEGGQMPLHMRMPKRGFNSRVDNDYAELNLIRLQSAIDAGRLDTSKTIDAAALIAARVIRREKDGVRVIGKTDLKAKLKLEVSGGSKGAIEAIEKAGGTVTIKAAKPKAGAE